MRYGEIRDVYLFNPGFHSIYVYCCRLAINNAKPGKLEAQHEIHTALPYIDDRLITRSSSI